MGGKSDFKTRPLLGCWNTDVGYPGLKQAFPHSRAAEPLASALVITLTPMGRGRLVQFCFFPPASSGVVRPGT